MTDTDYSYKAMTKQEIDSFWERVNQAAAEVSTWPKWNGGDGLDRGKLLEKMASDGTEAL